MSFWNFELDSLFPVFPFATLGTSGYLGPGHSVVSFESSQQFFLVVLLPSLLARRKGMAHGVEITCFGSCS